METTTSPTDLFIQGKDFFAVAAPGTLAGPVPATGAYYTRAGAFRLDNTGRNLITPDNFNVLDSASNPIVFSKFNTTATPKTAAVPDPTTLPPQTGTAFDSATAAGYAPGEVVSVGGINYVALKALAAPVAPATLASPVTDITNWQRGTFNPLAAYLKGDVVTGADGSNYVNISAIAGSDPISDRTNWELILQFEKVVSVSTKGEISLLYSDNTGKSATLFYDGNGAPPVSSSPATFVGTAKVPNPPGMVKVGGSLYRESGVVVGGSGTPIIGGPNGSTEQIISSNLELSNVDLASEFVKMIQTQRAYSANSKTITTSDEMMQEVLNLKR